jgi:hypothetical protein
MFLRTKFGTKQWRLIIDLCELNRYCFEFNMTCETLKQMSQSGDCFVSLYPTDGYYTLGIREEDRDYFTVNYRGTMWRLGCLPMGWSGSAYYFCKLTHVLTPLQTLLTQRPMARYPHAALHGRLHVRRRLIQRRATPSPTRRLYARPSRSPTQPQDMCLDAYPSRRRPGPHHRLHPRRIPRPTG